MNTTYCTPSITFGESLTILSTILIFYFTLWFTRRKEFMALRRNRGMYLEGLDRIVDMCKEDIKNEYYNLQFAREADSQNYKSVVSDIGLDFLNSFPLWDVLQFLVSDIKLLKTRDQPKFKDNKFSLAIDMEEYINAVKKEDHRNSDDSENNSFKSDPIEKLNNENKEQINLMELNFNSSNYLNMATEYDTLQFCLINLKGMHNERKKENEVRGKELVELMLKLDSIVADIKFNIDEAIFISEELFQSEPSFLPTFKQIINVEIPKYGNRGSVAFYNQVLKDRINNLRYDIPIEEIGNSAELQNILKLERQAFQLYNEFILRKSRLIKEYENILLVYSKQIQFMNDYLYKQRRFYLKAPLDLLIGYPKPVRKYN